MGSNPIDPAPPGSLRGWLVKIVRFWVLLIVKLIDGFLTIIFSAALFIIMFLMYLQMTINYLSGKTNNAFMERYGFSSPTVVVPIHPNLELLNLSILCI